MTAIPTDDSIGSAASANRVFRLLCRGRSVPQNWGFPFGPGIETVASHSKSSVIRRSLLPLSDEEGFAQLLRWHYSILRSRRHVWRSIAGDVEIYEPSWVYKTVAESPDFIFVPDPDGGILALDWIWSGETTVLSALLTPVSGSQVDIAFGDEVIRTWHSYETNTDSRRIGWPEWMGLKAAIQGGSWTEGVALHASFRVKGFDTAVILESAVSLFGNELNSVGLLADFIEAPNPLDKIAILWLAVAILEHDDVS